MVVSIGCDVLHISRIEKLLKYRNFLNKYFTKNEINMFNEVSKNDRNYIKKISSNFSVKESIYKAISREIDLFKFTSVEVLRDFDGRPYVNLYGNLKKINTDYNLHVTISNEINIVTSFVVLEKIN